MVNLEGLRQLIDLNKLFFVSNLLKSMSMVWLVC
jgi:hypothetical protein